MGGVSNPPAPPRGVRARFWLLGMRVPDEHRPWAAAALLAPDHLARRRRMVLALHVPLIVLPQLLVALLLRSWFNLALAALALVAFVGASQLRALSPTRAERARLLAHHGVTPDGQLVEPVSMWRAQGVSPAASALLVVIVLVLGTGTVVAADHHVSPDRCRAAPEAHVAAVEPLLGRTELQGGSSSPPLFTGATLRDAQQVRSTFDGVVYLAGHVSGAPGEPVAVWRVI